MILTENGVLKLMQRIKSFITSQLNTKANSVHTHTLSEIDDLSSLQMGGGYSKSEVDTLLTGKADTGHTHIKSQITDFPTIPTKTSDLTNDSGFLTSHQDLSGYIPITGGAVMTGGVLGRTINNSSLTLSGSTGWSYGASVSVYGKDSADNSGVCFIRAYDGIHANDVTFYPIGTILFGSNFAFNNDTTFRIGSVNGFYSLFRYDGVYWNNSDHFIPLNNLVISLGGGGNAWKDCFLLNAPVVVSDSRAKTQTQDVDDKLLDAWSNVEIKTDKMVSAVEKKGEKARYHIGYLAQDIQAECEKQGINASNYGLFCYDEWEEQEEISEEIETEKDGKIIKEKRVIQPKREKGNSYALRYEEALVVECAYLRREINKLKEELNLLKAK